MADFCKSSQDDFAELWVPRLSILWGEMWGFIYTRGFIQVTKPPAANFSQKLESLLVPSMSVVAIPADNECYKD